MPLNRAYDGYNHLILNLFNDMFPQQDKQKAHAIGDS